MPTILTFICSIVSFSRNILPKHQLISVRQVELGYHIPPQICQDIICKQKSLRYGKGLLQFLSLFPDSKTIYIGISKSNMHNYLHRSPEGGGGGSSICEMGEVRWWRSSFMAFSSSLNQLVSGYTRFLVELTTICICKASAPYALPEDWLTNYNLFNKDAQLFQFVSQST